MLVVSHQALASLKTLASLSLLLVVVVDGDDVQDRPLTAARARGNRRVRRSAGVRGGGGGDDQFNLSLSYTASGGTVSL